MMMTEKIPPEPSMDEILASIRQLISSDVQGNPQPFLPEPHGEDILDLTEVFPEDNAPTLSSSDVKYQELKDWASNTNQQTWSEVEERAPQSSFSSASASGGTSFSYDEPLLSQTVLSEATQAFDLLKKNVRENPSVAPSQGQEGLTSQPLENLIREMLKPLLKEWLDAHLPSLVHAIVSQQVEKIVQQVK